LQEITFVKRWIAKGDFVRLSKSIKNKEKNKWLLMVELKGSYWAIGYIYGADSLELPLFVKEDQKLIDK
jgi:hypothetical protein